jgi:hypothetical protein
VVNVMPKRNANSILNLRIAHFQVHDANKFALHQAVVSLPEVRAWLAQNQLTEHTPYGMLGPIGAMRQLPVVSLEMNNLTLREIMNRIVKEPGFSGWLLARYGEQNQYLEIHIG